MLHYKTIKIIVQNVSLNVQSLNPKFDQLKIFLHDLNDHGHKISAICIQETWLSDQQDKLIFQSVLAST